MVFAGVGDIVTVAPAASLSLQLRGPFAEALSDSPRNLVLEAARLLAKAIGCVPNVTITLDKWLPVSAGLGGGSADAAATLRGLARLWNVERSAERLLAAIALALGADVPVCLYGAPAHVSGIGATIEPALALPSAWLVLVNPLRPLATASVFRARISIASSAAMPIADVPSDAISLAQALAAPRRNDLRDAAIALEPAIRTVLDVLAPLPGCLLTRMSGSGATCFGLFADGTAARAAARVLATNRPSWWSTAAPLLPPM
ncbi:4-diphosphocytidyl-2-C-methyl-D-erythritol kinase [invertebrate metagenome]|uniref:4-(cytidine 5'-diphospho)-2-C-methyl-D-erythritol kinase n=1 Tax=invertebrate metagenome TaxID=1711999 RepID=A0A484H6U2_9ZZZZ